MDLDDATRAAVDVALNEAEVLGLRMDTSDACCDLLLHVCALPDTGPLDRDPRRLLRLTSPSQVDVVLRPDRVGLSGYGPAVPLDGLDQVEAFFGSLSWTGSMYGWKFLDDPAATDDWPTKPSLSLDLRSGAGSHSMYWFNECGRVEDGTQVAYCIEGIVSFEDLAVLRGDGTPQPLTEFIADGARYWEALHSGDERLGIAAQRVAQDTTPSWRTYARTAVIVSGRKESAPE